MLQVGHHHHRGRRGSTRSTRGEANYAIPALRATRPVAAAARGRWTAASSCVLAAPVDEICCSKLPERTPEMRHAAVMGWDCRSASRGGFKGASFAGSTSTMNARHLERRPRPALHRRHLGAKNLGDARTVYHLQIADDGVSTSLLDSPVALIELYRRAQ